ncbi:amino acid permease [Schizosaccharomyces japonicus yFS275]|uniref:Amino acid permease n=1 Tax=Schizosaccharomyces japonicus (strain yFS275 / FY16936) TaxID=402676 RepID=B6K609_SCHJY|nr:amino acid permease [Schizosaccharomyces japonicus yFS275]EEB08963.1 amino acid permease [Schizosaccharomyces japonicus yFS275]
MSSSATEVYSQKKDTSSGAQSISVAALEAPVPYDEPDNAEDLAKLGYKQSFKRQLSLFGVFSVSFSVLGLLPSVAATLSFTMGVVGTPGMVWGWLVAMIFVECVAASMAELCSSMPTSGGLYYSAAMLAPKGWGPLASWVTGWSNYIGQLIGFPSCVYSLSSMILNAVAIQRPSYTVENYQIFLLSLGFVVIFCIMASLPTKIVGRINSVGTFLNTLFLFISMIVILASGGHRNGFNKSSDVWGKFNNTTSWPNGFAVLMSFCGVIWTMMGYDTPFHLSEECANASVNAPNGIILTSTVGGLVGWLFQLIIAYTIVDLNAVVSSDNLWDTFLNQVLSKNAAMAIISLTIVSNFIMSQGVLVASSRIAYSYARDEVLPFSNYMAMVHPKTKTPIVAVVVNSVIGLCVIFLVFAGPVTINAVFSVSATAAFVAFTTPVCMRTFFVKDEDFPAGPWNLGKFSRPIGFVAVCFVLVMIPVLCFPTKSNPTASEMNWTCLVYGVPMGATLIWYAVSARKWFKGPKVSLDSTGPLNMSIEGVEMPQESPISKKMANESEKAY